MPDTYAADDYGSISQHLKALEDARRRTAAEPQSSATRWGIWMEINPADWAHVIGPGNWRHTGPLSLGQDLLPTLYATRQEAQEIIDLESEVFRKVCKPREYPAQ